MNVSEDRPKHPTYKLAFAWMLGAALIYIGASSSAPEVASISTLLVGVGFAAWAYCALLEVRHDRAEKRWLSAQPAELDPYRYAPELPQFKQGVAFGTGAGAFAALAYFGLQMRNGEFTGEAWWLIPLVPLTFAGFGYARRIQTAHWEAIKKWRANQGGQDTPDSN